MNDCDVTVCRTWSIHKCAHFYFSMTSQICYNLKSLEKYVHGNEVIVKALVIHLAGCKLGRNAGARVEVPPRHLVM